MARDYYEAVVTDRQGNVVPYATVTVYIAGTTTLATIYDSEDGPPRSNPFQADGEGRFSFYAEEGWYDINVSSNTLQGQQRWRAWSVPSQAELDSRYVNVTGDTMSGALVVGTDPGGTEDLRAGSARLNAPVLVGNVPQFTLASEPTASAEVATKSYVDARAASKKRSIVLAIPGNPAAGAMVSMQIVVPCGGTITAVKSTCRVAPSSTYTYDINKNGTTIYTTQANRPTRTSGDGTGVKTHTMPDVTSFSAGDVFTVDLDSAGSGISDVAFFIEFEEGA